MGKPVFLRGVCRGHFGSIDSTPHCWIAGCFDSVAARSGGVGWFFPLRCSGWRSRYWQQKYKLIKRNNEMGKWGLYLNIYVSLPSLKPTKRLMNHYPWIWQAVSLSFRSEEEDNVRQSFFLLSRKQRYDKPQILGKWKTPKT